MNKSYKIFLSMLLFFIFSSSFADVTHRDGYSYMVSSKRLKLDTDEEFLQKFMKAFGQKLETISDRKLAPKLRQSDGEPITYLLRNAGKPRGDKPARRTTTLMAFNLEVPQAVKDLAIAEFGAKPEDFKAFPNGFRFKIAERRSGKFSARFYLYRKDKERDGTPDTVDLGDGTILTMPKGVYKFKSKTISSSKSVIYTLRGTGNFEVVAEELKKGLKDAGFETKANAKNTNITFKKGKIYGSVEFIRVSSQASGVHVLIVVY